MRPSAIFLFVNLILRFVVDDSDIAMFCSTECMRKASAEDFPRNFALIRLAERTVERQRQEKEEADRRR